MNGHDENRELKWSELRNGVRTLQLSGIVRLRDAMGTGEILVSQRYVAASPMRAKTGGRGIYMGAGLLNGLKEAGLLPPD
jgi:hypothetical protein